jgi:hypothetical protein
LAWNMAALPDALDGVAGSAAVTAADVAVAGVVANTSGISPSFGDVA